jgi:hypothetical protein
MNRSQTFPIKGTADTTPPVVAPAVAAAAEDVPTIPQDVKYAIQLPAATFPTLACAAAA